MHQVPRPWYTAPAVKSLKQHLAETTRKRSRAALLTSASAASQQQQQQDKLYIHCPYSQVLQNASGFLKGEKASFLQVLEFTKTTAATSNNTATSTTTVIYRGKITNVLQSHAHLLIANGSQQEDKQATIANYIFNFEFVVCGNIEDVAKMNKKKKKKKKSVQMPKKRKPTAKPVQKDSKSYFKLWPSNAAATTVASSSSSSSSCASISSPPFSTTISSFVELDKKLETLYADMKLQNENKKELQQTRIPYSTSRSSLETLAQNPVFVSWLSHRSQQSHLPLTCITMNHLLTGNPLFEHSSNCDEAELDTAAAEQEFMNKYDYLNMPLLLKEIVITDLAMHVTCDLAHSQQMQQSQQQEALTAVLIFVVKMMISTDYSTRCNSMKFS